MKIHVTSGVGTGPTPLAAFDAAVMTATGLNQNMIYLSCFIPPGTEIVREMNKDYLKSWGQKVYVVMSRADATIPGSEAWSSLGWVQDSESKGMFVEFHGSSEDYVKESILKTLNFMKEKRNDGFGDIFSETAGIRCESEPVCSVTMAVYKLEKWER